MSTLTVGDIENILFQAFPASWATPDDRFGLFVGDRNRTITKIAIALDSTVPMIETAAAKGCNILVTHHPPFWFAPMRFTAAQTAGQVDGAAVFAAARADVALLALHTNVDCAPAAYQLLLEMIGLNFLRPLQPEINLLGQIAEPGEATAIELEALACKCQQAFGQVYSVWGSPSKPIKTIAICSGGASEVLPSVIKVKPDCFITGELAHHEHLYLADADIALIELGHDLSELPYCSLFISTLKAAGVAEDLIEMIKPSATWWTPSNQQNETIFDPFPRQVTSNPLRNVHADLAPRQVTLLTDQSDKQSTKGRSLE